MLGVLACDEITFGETGKSRWYYSLATGTDPRALSSPDLATPPPTPPRSREAENPSEGTPKPTPANSGEDAPHVSVLNAAFAAAAAVPVCDCGHPLDQHAAPGCDVPVVHRPPDLWSTPDD